jgi:hypothetical protein
MIAACDGATDPTVDDLASRAASCAASELALQVYGLLAVADRRRRHAWMERARGVPVQRSARQRALRLDILSIHECTESPP